ncbi:MAG: hypothetical protein QOF81_1807, partial [Acidimicrobiaceae bacterium]|nr:hypothetical protein [Acidimicrobiaceae bacterium]
RPAFRPTARSLTPPSRAEDGPGSSRSGRRCAEGAKTMRPYAVSSVGVVVGAVHRRRSAVTSSFGGQTSAYGRPGGRAAVRPASCLRRAEMPMGRLIGRPGRGRIEHRHGRRVCPRPGANGQRRLEHVHRPPPDLRFEPVSAWGALGKPYAELYLSSKSSIGARRPVTSTSNMAAWPASA